jgi:death on curing protein
VVRAIHAEQLAEHGGAQGLRDAGLLAACLARPRNKEAYADADLFELAAAYAYALARSHPFVDGNKRTALVASFTFLAINGCEVEADETEAVQVFQELAAGDIDERSLADWLRRVGRRIADERLGDDGG